METKDPKSTETAGGEGGAVESKDPKADATSSETLSDVEETEKVSETGGDTADTNEQSPVPSPDGAFDEGRKGGGLEDAGPM
ncbi:MAG TPA: hypothetical protein VJ715_03005 [Pyrinomonadaceae bacterium]|nr:hypothetical protein [Pyrinomonadaceae bacterium]